MRRIEDMGINELLGIIRREPDGERRERTLAAALSSLIEIEIEWRLDLRHQNSGYHKASSIAGAGEARGQLTGRVDHVGLAAERYRYACRWRSMSEALLAHLNERQRMAVLLCGYPLTPVIGCQSARMMTLSRVADRQPEILQRLGWSPMSGYGVAEWIVFKPRRWSLAPKHSLWHQRQRIRQLRAAGDQSPFRTMRAMRDTAYRARLKLLPLVLQQAKMTI